MRAAVAGLVIGACWLQTRATLPQSAVAIALLAGGGILLWSLVFFRRRRFERPRPFRELRRIRSLHAIHRIHGMPTWRALRRPRGLRLWYVLPISIAMQRLRDFRLPGFSGQRLHPSFFVLPLMIAAGAAIGVGWSSLHAHSSLSAELPLALEGEDIELVGVIDSLPQHFERGTRFSFLVERGPPRMPPRIALSWYANGPDASLQHALMPGERWRFTVRLRRPHGNANPHGFDYEAWLLEQSLRATGYVRPVADGTAGNHRLDDFVPGFSNFVERCRALLRARMQAALGDRPYAGIIVALVIGDQREISAADWKMFNATGVGHLVSISGLHITMIAGLFGGAMEFLWRHSFFIGSRLPLLLPAQKAAALTGAIVALLYVLLSGFGVPAQRTLYMLTVVAWAIWSGRATRVSHVLCIALAVVILLDPMAVLWPGFWLSFGAVAVILYAGAGRAGSSRSRQRWRNALQTAVRTQYAVSIGLVPLTMLLFSQVSLVSPVANAVAIPLISFVVTPLSLVGSILPQPLAAPVLAGAHQVTAWLAAFLQWLAQLPVAVWIAPTPEWWMFALALAGMALMLAPRGWPARSAGLLLWLPLVLHRPSTPEYGLQITAFDVGQGTAVLIETPRHRLLYDTGPFYTPEADGGSRVILPYLRARGIRSLDTMVVSHNDNDHSGGAATILSQIDVGRVLSSLESDSTIVAAAAKHHRCQAGQRWDWDGARFEMLHPDPADYQRKRKPNARSCALKISSGGHVILLPGDIEAAQERRLVADMPQRLRANVLLVPHHGSGTSSTPAFLNAVRPEVAIFQVGYRNRFRHPKAEVYQRYGELQVERFRTDWHGAIEISAGNRLTVSAWRLRNPRYWHGR